VSARDGELPDPAGAAVWGLARSAQAEQPDRVLLVDLDDAPASEQALLSAVVWARGAEEGQLALRDGEALVPRLAPVDDAALDLVAAGPGWTLDAPQKGTLDGLRLVASGRAERPLQEGEVRVAVQAAGLNFRDVMVALGVVDGGGLIGGEGAGRVVETAGGDLRVGETVMGLMDGAFGPLAVADARAVVPVPAGLTVTEAASVPIAFPDGVVRAGGLAGVRPGERVLVHAGAGGVGVAAIQIARHLGCEVVATASPSKWWVLRGLGLSDDAIASSRDLGFEARLGRVDVVLNALAGGVLWTRRCGCWGRVAGSWRWARPTSAIRRSSRRRIRASRTGRSTSSTPATTASASCSPRSAACSPTGR
jgi:hypothetical protein